MGPSWALSAGPRWAPCWPHEPCYQECFGRMKYQQVHAAHPFLIIQSFAWLLKKKPVVPSYWSHTMIALLTIRCVVWGRHVTEAALLEQSTRHWWISLIKLLCFKTPCRSRDATVFVVWWCLRLFHRHLQLFSVDSKSLNFSHAL